MKKHKGTPRTIHSRVLNERRTVYEKRDDGNDLIAIVDGRDDINWEAMNGNPICGNTELNLKLKKIFCWIQSTKIMNGSLNAITGLGLSMSLLILDGS
jgi:hypothetical protein